MTRALLYLALPWLALVLLPAPALTAPEPPWLAGMELAAEGHHLLPVGLLARLRRYEGNRDVVRRHRAGLVCGRYQILAHDSWRLCRMVRGPAGTWIAAQLLAESREWCAGRGRRCPCPEARWNWLDRTALCAALRGES